MEINVVEQQMSTNPAVIKVIGTGGAGTNAVNRMIDNGVQGIEFIAANTDVQALSYSKAEKKLQIGAKLTSGLGAGGKPEIGEQAAVESTEEIKQLIAGSDMLFITAGMGGGTGTGSAPIIAKLAKDLGILTVAVVTKPFGFEGKAKMALAEEGITKLSGHVDSLIVIPNQMLLKVVPAKMGLNDAFKKADEVLQQAVQGISDLIVQPGLMNVDLADVESAMRGQGNARMGVGIGSGENRATDAATHALENPLLEDCSMDGAKNILVNICGASSLGLSEISDIMEIINQKADPNAKIKVGAWTNEEMGDSISVTLVATGFPDSDFLSITNNCGLAADSKSDAHTAGDYIGVNEFNLMKMKKPTFAGLEKRNSQKKLYAVEDEAAEPVEKFKAGDIKVSVPADDVDLDIPTFLRQKRGN